MDDQELERLFDAKDRRRILPRFHVRFMYFDGDTTKDPIKAIKEIEGSITDVIRMLDEVLEASITTSDYPIVALQRLARNAILHCTYEGTNAPVLIYWFAAHIEIYNQGGPYGQVTRQNFGRSGLIDYRNPYLAEAMKDLGYIERFGRGIPLAKKELAENGNPPPEFIVEDTNVTVVLRRQKVNSGSQQ